MNTLNNHTLLYDTECPLCNFYTNGFIKTEMLDRNGRKPFENLTKKELKFIDVKRATNEIALVDTKNENVIYGIDSLLKVIGNSFPVVEKIGKTSFVYFGLKKLYSFVSYNRKVIIPSEKKEVNVLECNPSFNIKYRFLFIFFSVLVTAYTLFNFSSLITSMPIANFKIELMIAAGQIAFQGMFLVQKGIKRSINYIGNLMTVSLIGCIGLFQILLLNAIIGLPQLFILCSFGGVVLLMFFEHKRRVKLLALPSYLSYTWVAYRMIVLLLLIG